MKSFRFLAAASCAALAASCTPAVPEKEESAAPAPAPLVATSLPAVRVGPEIAGFYKERRFQPLWVKRGGLSAEGRRLIAIIEKAGRDGLSAETYDLPLLRRAAAAAAGADPATAAKAELLLSQAFVRYVNDLHVPRDQKHVFLVDPELAPRPLGERAVLEAAAAAPSLARHLDDVRRMNPLYDALKQALAQYRANGGSAAGERVILANLERARSIPADPSPRYVIVDTAGARLWMIEDGRVVDSMKTIVGKPGMATPEMAGLIRHAVLNPYWNLPPDLARERAKRVLKRGPRMIAAERLEILSDWSDSPRPVAPSRVNWRAVASGAQALRMRQLPGADNVMGNVKFMLPNRLGIYLHDTPNKADFQREERRLSSGCVRVEDAARLSRWLFAGRTVAPSGPAPEQRVDLPEPVPVYITYLTAVPKIGGGVVFRRDHYRRDAALLARLEDRGRQKRA